MFHCLYAFSALWSTYTKDYTRFKVHTVYGNFGDKVMDGVYGLKFLLSNAMLSYQSFKFVILFEYISGNLWRSLEAGHESQLLQVYLWSWLVIGLRHVSGYRGMGRELLEFKLITTGLKKCILMAISFALSWYYECGSGLCCREL